MTKKECRGNKTLVDRKKIVSRFTISGVEVAVYIVTPIILGYFVGRHFGNVGIAAGLFIGSILGLVIAVKRAIKMTL